MLTVLTTSDFPVWRTVKLGEQRAADAYVESYLRRGIPLRSWTRHALRQTPMVEEPTEAKLVRVKVRDLHLPVEVNLRELLSTIFPVVSVRYCRPEVALALRDSYLDQPRDELLYVGMWPVKVDDRLHGFYLDNKNGPMIEGYDWDPDWKLSPNNSWVFELME